MIYRLLRPLMFRMEPESAHDFVLQVAKLSPKLGALTGINFDPRLSVKIGTNQWSFPVGLAAGLDKNAEGLNFFSSQGFGCIECGTVTLRPQLGNPKPRLFRYPEEMSLRNAMGFPNHGLLEIMPRLKERNPSVPLGVNIGKNKESSAAESIEELCLLYETLEDLADYFVINVSSPNTPGLRDLQTTSYLSELFSSLNFYRKNSRKDLYLKISPDLAPEKVRELTHLCREHQITGLIATNTTMLENLGPGGVSGVLLRDKSRQIRQIILEENLDLELIGVGGFTTPKDLFDFWYDGGKVIQIYTAYVYQGPAVMRNFQSAIIDFLVSRKIETLETFFTLSLVERRKHLDAYLKSVHPA
jgi:dihydroorotate dehydrogenase